MSVYSVNPAPPAPCRVLGYVAAVMFALVAAGPAAGAQWATTYSTAYLPGGFNWEFRDRYRQAADIVNAFAVVRATANTTLLRSPNRPAQEADATQLAVATRILTDPPRLHADAAATTAFARLVPEVNAMLDWVGVLRRQSYDVWADPTLTPSDQDARLTELLGYYRTRRDIMFSAVPRSIDIVDGQLYSFAFRERYPGLNGVLWASQWLETGLYEALLTRTDASESGHAVDAALGRFHQMVQGAPGSTPHVMPLTPAIAPGFAARYPTLSVIFDNAHMMENVVRDILASREIPQSAKRPEILRAAELFRNDTAYAVSYETWMQVTRSIGVENMGGPAVGFAPALPTPTVARGASMAGRMAPSGEMAGSRMPGMQGMEHGVVPRDTGAMRAVYERMMADPVIRERAATDPLLQRLMRDAGLTPPTPQGAMPMAGMDHGAMSGAQGGNMSGMQHGATPMKPPAANMSGLRGIMLGPDASPADRRQAIEFIVRLLSDPAVEGRIHADPELHRLWSDPDVQRRLLELRASQTPASARQAPVPAPTPPRQTPPPSTPSTPSTPPHRHP